MSAHPPFQQASVEAIAKILGESMTGGQIDKFLEGCNLIDDSGESTKWRRLYAIFLKSQKTTNSSNQILGFIKSSLAPVRFVNNPDEFEQCRDAINAILKFEGLEYKENGQFRLVDRATTVRESASGDRQFRVSLHPEVRKYAEEHILQGNLFHATFEACKGLLQKIRDMSNLTEDGENLINKAFSLKNPHIGINGNQLKTDSERSEYMGLASELKGAVKRIRNPAAHDPKIQSNGAGDGNRYRDDLHTISLLHKRLDNCFRMPKT